MTMKKRWFILAALLAMPVFGQVASMEPTTQPAPAKLFRSRLAGIQLLPPAGGTLIRKLDNGEIVRFVYRDRGWDIRVKPVPLHKSMTTSDLLGLIAKQLVESNASAEIISTHTTKIGGHEAGLLEARYNAGADRLFAQQALVRSDDQSFFLIQMGSPTTKAKNAPADPPDPLETSARAAFEAMLPTVKLLDRSALADEMYKRLQNTKLLWVQIDKNKITRALIPEHFMRIVRDGKDVGFVQVNERVASHSGRPGVEVIVRSRLQTLPNADAGEREKPVATAAMPDPTAIVVPLLPSQKTGAQAQPSNLYTLSTFFFSFDREDGYAASHEDWETLAQVDEERKDQIDERGTSDLVVHRMLDREKLEEELKVPTTGPSSHHDENPPVIERGDFELTVSQDLKNRRAPSIDRRLTWFYLPQGMGQLLPRLLPLDEQKQYLFASFVSGEHEVMGRYVDVDPMTEVTLDGRQLLAIPISDRIGVDGIPTIHYMTPSGQWLGSVSEEGKMQVLPTTEKALAEIWPGFVASAPPPLEADSNAVKSRASRQ
jgi:hypothetical protein